MEDQINQLEYISNSQPIRNLLETFINEHSLQLKNKEGWVEKNEYSLLVMDEFFKLSLKISDEHQITFNAAKTFITLDKKLYPKLSLTPRNKIQKKLILNSKKLKDTDIFNYGLDAEKYETIYKEDQVELIGFLNKNINLFPNSTKTYIKSKQKELQEKSKLTKILNEFEARVFEKELEEKFNFTKLKTMLKFFRNIKNDHNRLLTIFYFHKTIKNKYKNTKETNKFMDLCDESFNTFFAGIKETTNGSPDNNRINLLKKILTLLKTENELLDKVFHKIGIKECNNNITYFLFKAAKTPEHIEKLNENISLKLADNFKYRPIKWETCSTVFQRQMIEEAKRQFLIEYPHFDF